jgi:hypothetical protein
MSFTGHVQDGAVVMDEPLPLPNGTAVRVDPLPEPASSAESPKPKTLNERLKEFLAHSLDLPPDASVQHDHYLYGTPKR